MENTEAVSQAERGEENVRDERRANERFDCDGSAEVAVIDGGTLFRGKILDISRTGCYIETRAWLGLGLQRFTEVELRFTVEGLRFSVLARLMQVRRGKGVGFEFSVANAQLEDVLSNLIQKLNAVAP